LIDDARLKLSKQVETEFSSQRLARDAQVAAKFQTLCMTVAESANNTLDNDPLNESVRASGLEINKPKHPVPKSNSLQL
jgi:hypothetical protein